MTFLAHLASWRFKIAVIKPYKPTKEEIAAAVGKTVPDLMGPGLKVLFCGINPGLYSGAVAHHFARPGNRFWPALHAAGFTDRILSPFEERELLKLGYGITNIVARATAQADEIGAEELRAGAQDLERKVRELRPGALAVLGIDAFRKAFRRPGASVGKQPERIENTLLWVLPNPSGINASYQLADLVRLFAELRGATAL